LKKPRLQKTLFNNDIKMLRRESIEKQWLKETSHIKPNGVEIAETILLLEDPLRAKFIAENFLEKPVLFNEIRGMLGYTGDYFIEQHFFLSCMPLACSRHKHAQDA